MSKCLIGYIFHFFVNKMKKKDERNRAKHNSYLEVFSKIHFIYISALLVHLKGRGGGEAEQFQYRGRHGG